MEKPLLPTFAFNAYPQTDAPLAAKPPTEALEPLVVYRREEKFATCRQHIELHTTLRQALRTIKSDHYMLAFEDTSSAAIVAVAD
jgi:hypothetical protein